MITVVGIRLIHTHTHGYHACREASTTRVESRTGPRVSGPRLGAGTARGLLRAGREGGWARAQARSVAWPLLREILA